MKQSFRIKRLQEERDSLRRMYADLLRERDILAAKLEAFPPEWLENYRRAAAEQMDALG